MRSIQLSALLLALFAAPLWAGLVETHFPGKSETDVAAEFEAGLPKLLTEGLSAVAKPRMYALVNKAEVFVQLTAVEGEQTTWTTLVPTGWYAEQAEYAYDVYGKDYKFKLSELPPAGVAFWLRPQGRSAALIVSLACWLAAKGELMLADAELAALVPLDGREKERETLKKEIDDWLCAKLGWSAPGGLETIATHDLDHNEDGWLLLSKEAAAEHFKDLDKEAKKAFKELEKLQGADVKSKPGQRKNSPGMRLAILEKYIQRWERRYTGTAFLAKKGAKEDLEAMLEAVKADMAWIETEKYKAERFGIDGDWNAAARAYDQMQRADPLNPDVVIWTAEAWSKAAKITDGGRKADDPAAAKRAAGLYEQLLAIFPKAMGYHNHAGLNWLAAGDKGRAKEHHEEVIRRTDGIKDLSESDKKNREFAEGQLKLMK
ncbi:MAG: hypothetical protein H6841_10570 [Planctomycetes bacterium]|nr:hypothetical protein [Planctomycetota bacterium]MCB9936601.1 hypothetical protein [Planctomycetota bacterium]